MPNSQNPLLLHANIMIQDGLYKNVLIHIIIRIPQDYPHSAPSANIAPGHPFTGNFHEHVIASNNEYGASICSDLLSPFPVFYDQKLRPSFTKNGKYFISGWSPAYSLSSILVQLQVFFANHDFPETKNLNPQRIQSMKEATQKFTFDVTIDDGITQQIITHSYTQPYPPFTRQTPQSSPGYKNEELELAMKEESNSNSDTCDEENEYFDTDIFVKNFIKNATNKPRATLQGVHFEEEKKNSFIEQDKESLIHSSQKVLKQQIASKLVCSISKQTIFDKPMPTLGYLMLVWEASYNRLWVTPVIELNSKESFEQSFQSDIARSGMRNYPFYRTSVFGNGYNFWMPLYINKKHYEQSRDDIQSSISQIYNMVMRTRENPEPFHPKMVLMVLPPILVKTVIHMLKDDLHQSLAALDAYSQFYWLFMKLVNHYPEIQQQIDEDVDRFLTKEEFRHKRKLGDLGEFMFKLSLSRRGINNTDINKALLEVFFARQVTWAKKRRPDLRNFDVENLVPTFIGASRVACQFFLVQFESAKLMVNDSVRAQLEEGYGCVSSAQLERFMDKVNWIRDNMKYSWKILINNIGLGQVLTKQTQVEEMIKSAFEKESQLYSKWTVVQCETLGIGLDDWRLPKFGYFLNREILTHYRYMYYKSEGELVINPNLRSHLSSYITSKDIYWLPVYINESHFERIRTSYDTHINALYSEIARLDKSKANITEGAAIKVKVFSNVLAQCFVFIGKRRLDKPFVSERKQDKALCIAYIQLLWTFWKLLEHDVNMEKILNQEVDLFKQDNSYRESLSWKTLIEVAIKFVLSERGGEGSEGWDCFFEEIVRKYTDEATLMIDGSNHENPVSKKFGWFKQLEIKQILKTIQMTKIVLNDRYRAQLESNNGFLKEYDLDEVRSDIRQIQSHKGDDLMSLLLKIWDLKKETTAFGDMSTRIQIKINEVKKKVKTGEAFVEILGSKFMVKINKKKKEAK